MGDCAPITLIRGSSNGYDQQGINPLGSAYHATSRLTLSTISGHKDGNTSESACTTTSCPGDTFYPLLSAIRNEVAQTIGGNGASCTYSLGSTSLSSGNNGGAGSVLVQTTSGCTWSATSNASWISITSGGSGNGNGWVNYSVGANTGTSQRSGTMTIAGQTFTVTQSGASCTYSLGSTSATFGNGGGEGVVTIGAATECPWTAASNSNWITITSGGTGSGCEGVYCDYRLDYLVSSNPGTSVRTGSISIAGQPVTVTQLGMSCSFLLSSTAANFPASGGSGTVPVESPAGCAWTAVSDSNWLTITSGGNSSGAAALSYSVLANPSALTRTGRLTVAGQLFTVTQSGQSAPLINDEPGGATLIATLPFTATQDTVSATGNASDPRPSCTYVTPHRTVWFRLSANLAGRIRVSTAGSDYDTVLTVYRGEANPASQVSCNDDTPPGTASEVTFDAEAGQSYLIQVASYYGSGSGGLRLSINSQLVPCTYIVTPNFTGSVNGGGVGSSVTVTTANQCQWSSTSNNSWITISSSSTNYGSSAVLFTVAANDSGAVRSGTMTIAGETITVTQSPIGQQNGGLRFVSILPCRLLETRPAYAGTRWSGAYGPPALAAGATRTIPVVASPTCNLPQSAQAVVLNITLDTMEDATGPVDHVTVWPAGEVRPNFYTLRTTLGGYVANSAIVQLGANKALSIFSSARTHMVVDVYGYFTGDTSASGLLYYPVSPCRAVDTRSVYSTLPPPYGRQSLQNRETRTLRLPGSPGCSLPPAAAYSLQMTLVPGPEADGPRVDFITAWPTGTARPPISSMNAYFGHVTANSGIVPARADGSIDVYANNPTNVIIDVNGYFAPDDGSGRGLSYFAVPQCRVMNTQDPAYQGVFGPPAMSPTADRTVRIPGGACANLPASARAWAVNTWVVPNGASMPFLSLWPAGTPWPGVSQLNAFQGQTVANSSIAPGSANGEIMIRVNGSTHVALEVTGYFSR